jgi:hypothetical protein
MHQIDRILLNQVRNAFGTGGIARNGQEVIGLPEPGLLHRGCKMIHGFINRVLFLRSDEFAPATIFLIGAPFRVFVIIFERLEVFFV